MQVKLNPFYKKLFARTLSLRKATFSPLHVVNSKRKCVSSRDRANFVQIQTL